MRRILIIEDHKKLQRSLQRGLTAAGYEAVGVDSGEAGFYSLTTEPFDLVILDLMLPGRDGLEVLRDLRRLGCSVPVLILSARDSIDERVRGLDEGADDYLVKPFAFEELLARIRVQLKRTHPAGGTILKAGDLELRTATREVFRDGEEIELSRQEYRLLEYLARHLNQTVTRRAIARDVWDEPQGIATNVVDVYINGLRKKLERPGRARLIHTIRGVGYSMTDGSAEPAATTPAGRGGAP